MILGDCLEVMPDLHSESFDFVVADLPFHCTQFKWDTPIDLGSFWRGVKSLRKKASQTALSATLKFALALVASNRKEYRYDLIFNKYNGSGFLQAKRMPLRHHELLLLFAQKHGTYNPQMIPNPHPRRGKKNAKGTISETWGYKHKRYEYVYTGLNYPKSILPPLGDARTKSRHPAQKPVGLMNWLIRTYSNAGESVLDPVSGSFTSSVAACLSGRSSVGIEKDPDYFEAGVERVRKTVADNKLSVKLKVRR